MIANDDSWRGTWGCVHRAAVSRPDVSSFKWRTLLGRWDLCQAWSPGGKTVHHKDSVLKGM